MKAKTTVIVYRGPSAFDGSPIIAVVSGLGRPSSNEKTGAMAQLWILPDGAGIAARVRAGKDHGVCGTCPMASGRGCYVRTDRIDAWRWSTETLPTVDPETVREHLDAIGRPIRLGAYGDPAALPIDVARALIPAAGHTGYTHAWRYCSPDWRDLVMASCDDAGDARVARALGWRTFRVHGPDGAPERGVEIECLADSRGISCHDCGLCAGQSRPAKSIAIQGHGARARLVAAREAHGGMVDWNVKRSLHVVA